MRRSATVAVLLGAALAHARPELSIDPLDPRHELVIDLRVELPITIAAGAVLLGTYLSQDRYGPTTCRWCDTRSSLNALDAAGLQVFPSAHRAAAGTASDVLLDGVSPAFALGLTLASSLDATRGTRARYRARRYGIDVLLLVEATTTAISIDQLFKFTVQRRRPGYIDEPTDAQRTVNGNLSFFSGHATQTFVIASAAGTIASLRHERLAPLVWTLGLAVATTTSMLRVAANEHFVTDVLAGAVVGSAVGVIVPVLHRYRAPLRLGGAASAGGGLVTVSGLLD